MNLIVASNAQKQYKHLSKSDQVKVKKKLVALSNNPHNGKKLEGKLKGKQVVRAWPYRIIYFVNKKKNRIEVVAILHRQGAYS